MGLIDLTNKRFGRQMAIKHVGYNKYRNAMWLCKCDCGNEHIVASSKLIQGKSRSCGCLAKEIHISQLEKHGLTTNGKSRIFTIWCGVKDRCYNPKNVNYKNYGGRGISLCESWLSYENFHRWAVNNGYADELTIDRKDMNGNYTPENCQWIPMSENRLKQRRFTILTVLGASLPLGTFARKIGVSRYLLRKYYNINGKENTEKAISKYISTGKGQQYFVNLFLKRDNSLYANKEFNA